MHPWASRYNFGLDNFRYSSLNGSPPPVTLTQDTKHRFRRSAFSISAGSNQPTNVDLESAGGTETSRRIDSDGSTASSAASRSRQR